VIEAVPELLDLKNIFRRLASAAPKGALLASNTSTMSITRIAESSDAECVIGLHFFAQTSRSANGGHPRQPFRSAW
jgi:3-hydroxyacyl-CoA dehydrogenase